MTFNCRFETPCGFCEKFEKPWKEVCGMDKNDRFKMSDPHSDPSKLVNIIQNSVTGLNPMESINIKPLPTINQRTGKLEY